MSIAKILYKCLLIIESMQIISFAFNTKLERMFDSQISNIILEGFTFVQAENLLSIGNKTFNTFLVVFTTSVLALSLVFLGLMTSKLPHSISLNHL